MAVQTLAESFLADLDELSDDDEQDLEEQVDADDGDEMVRRGAMHGVFAWACMVGMHGGRQEAWLAWPRSLGLCGCRDARHGVGAWTPMRHSAAAV